MSQHHKAAHWSTQSRKTRPRIEATLPQPCIRCGGIITRDMKWDVGHYTDLAQPGDHTRTGPEHAHCNRRAGGRAGALKTNTRKTPTPPNDDRLPNW